jgi:endonuclease YncB( thermonuclease family)
MKLQAIIVATAIVISIGNIATANEVKGKVTHVRDADTIEVRGIPIRFDGVDAPDKGQPGFEKGKQWMQRNYAGRVVRCVLTGARDCPRYSGGKYRKYETARSRSVPLKAYCR